MQSSEVPVKFCVIFEVRNDKDLGILILTIRSATQNIAHFFKQHQQPIRQHPEQVQEIVRKCYPTTRKKCIQIDMTEFVRQYWNGLSFEFKGIKLNSTTQQAQKVYDRLINKAIGTEKRKKTIQESKQQKIDVKNNAIRLVWKKAENVFQLERARRLAELLGPPNTTEQMDD